ncbi:hypothetical protein ACFL6X_04405, partial [Candidatus Latescibacterota bacterium]
MPTLARLALWHAPEALPELTGAFDAHLVPVLSRYGLSDPQPSPRTSTPGVLNLLYPFEHPDAVRAASRAIAADPDWEAQMTHLGPLCGPDGSSSTSPARLRWVLGL